MLLAALVAAKFVCPLAWREAAQRFDPADKAPWGPAVDASSGTSRAILTLVGRSEVNRRRRGLPWLQPSLQLGKPGSSWPAHPANGVTRCRELGWLIALGWKEAPEDPSLDTPHRSVFAPGSALVPGTGVSAGTPLGQGLGCLAAEPPSCPQIVQGTLGPAPRCAPAASCSSAPKLC